MMKELPTSARWFDAHCHHASRDPRVAAVRNFKPNTLNTQTLASSAFFSLGIHPWWIADYATATLDDLFLPWIGHPQFLALGEIGLDAAIDTPLAVQQAVCRAQLAFAKLHAIPSVVIHCVRLYNELIALLKATRYEGRLILHDYNGNAQVTAELLKRPTIFFSFGKRLFDEKSRGYHMFMDLSADRLLLETDDQQDQHISAVYARACLLRSDLEEQQFTQNFKRAYIYT